MMIFFTQMISNSNKEITNLARTLLDERITAIKSVRGSGNNRVFRVETKNSFYALKVYPSTVGDKRDRLNSEFNSLSFLKKNGIENIPMCIARNNINRIGLYQWIEGKTIALPTKNDVSCAGAFVHKLASISKFAKKQNVPFASEACLSMQDIITQTDQRLNKLLAINDTISLTDFLQTKFVPLQKRIIFRAKEIYKNKDLDFRLPIDSKMHFLSPSDFGFHNTLRQKNGALFFFDFEYFGWDDPVKLTSDFILHPGHVLKEVHKKYFFSILSRMCKNDTTFNIRLDALFPLFGLRWCMILLNEFLPERMERRLLARRHADIKTAQKKQLEKAELMLQLVIKAESGFPYGACT